MKLKASKTFLKKCVCLFLLAMFMLAFPVLGQADDRYYFSIPRKFGDNPTVQLSLDSPPIERGFLPNTNWPGFETYNFTITVGTTLTLRADHPIVQSDDWGTLNFPTPGISLADSPWMQLFRQGAFGARSWTPINANTVQYTFDSPGEYHLDKDMLYRITVVQGHVATPPQSTQPSANQTTFWARLWDISDDIPSVVCCWRGVPSITFTVRDSTGSTITDTAHCQGEKEAGFAGVFISYVSGPFELVTVNASGFEFVGVSTSAGNLPPAYLADVPEMRFNVDMRSAQGGQPPTQQPPANNQTPQFTSPPTATDNGAWMEFNTVPNNRFGYRIFRASSATGDGISITDFPIMVNPAHSLDRIITFDPNLRPNRDYWFYVREVIEEARFDPATATLTPEVLGPASAKVHVRTSSNMTEPTAERGFIMMFIGNPFMNVNNIWEGIDPPQNQTVPVINAGRTMVPIRAIVEAMDGTVGWTPANSQMDLRSHGNHVQMWLGQRDARVNNASREMDIVPQIVNDRTLIPLRFVAEFLGAQVEWIGSEQMAVIVYELQ